MWARKALSAVAIFLFAVAVAGVVWVAILSRTTTTTLRTGAQQYVLEVVKTAAARNKGLSGRQSLLANQGMLFEFRGQDIRCFWMKDMHFALDIIWLGSDKRVQFIQPNALPGSYPKSFCPKYATQYVIELSAGQATKASLRPGKALTF